METTEGKQIQVIATNEKEYEGLRKLLKPYLRDNMDGCKIPTYPCLVTLHLYWDLWFTNHTIYLANGLFSYEFFVRAFNEYINAPICKIAA